jgi:hypothetical protein
MTSALHAALAGIDEAAGTEPTKERAMARGLMRGYHAEWQNQPDRAEAIEEEFRCAIYNLQAKRTSTSKTLSMGGKIDVISHRYGKRYVVDHKTTSDAIEDMDGTFWRQLAIESQVDMYLLAEYYQGRHVDGAIWDVIRKPAIRPKKIAKADQRRIVSERRYCNVPLSDEEVQHVVDHGDESADLYEYRVACDCIQEPRKFFQRKPVFRLEHELAAFADELWDLAQAVVQARRTAATRLPLRNSGACMLYGRPCQYLGICSGHDTPESSNWQARPSVHAELENNGDGRDLLTHSRIKCFQQCQRKHHYRYELAIERVDREKSAALAFGTTMHRGLECWWKNWMVSDLHNCNPT